MARELELVLGTECLWFEKFQREPDLKLFISRTVCPWKVRVLFIDQSTIQISSQCVVWNVCCLTGLDMLGYMLLVIICNLSQTSVVQLLTEKWPLLPALYSSTVTALALQNKGDYLVWPYNPHEKSSYGWALFDWMCSLEVWQMVMGAPEPISHSPQQLGVWPSPSLTQWQQRLLAHLLPPVTNCLLPLFADHTLLSQHKCYNCIACKPDVHYRLATPVLWKRKELSVRSGSAFHRLEKQFHFC